MQQHDRAYSVSYNVKKLLQTAEKANTPSIINMRRISQEILESEFDNREAGLADRTIVQNAINTVLSFGMLSKNPTIKSIGSDALNNIEKREDKLKSLKKDLDAAMKKIDSFSVDQIILTLEQLPHGLEFSIQYALNGIVMIGRGKLKEN